MFSSHVCLVSHGRGGSCFVGGGGTAHVSAGLRITDKRAYACVGTVTNKASRKARTPKQLRKKPIARVRKGVSVNVSNTEEETSSSIASALHSLASQRASEIESRQKGVDVDAKDRRNLRHEEKNGVSDRERAVAVKPLGEFDYRNGYGKTEAAEKERRERISLANTGRQPWNRGVPHRKETKARIRQALVETYAKNPELVELVRMRQLGRKHSHETRQKIRQARLAHVESKAGQKERRKKVNFIWQRVLCIQERREALYYERKKQAEERRQSKKAQAKLVVGGRKSKSKGKKTNSNGSSVSVRQMSEEHRRRISQAMKKKWKTKEFREKVESGMAERNALQGRMSYNGNTSKLVRSAQLERIAMRKKQEKLKKRAAELLAMAHAAAEHLKTMSHDEDQSQIEGLGPLSTAGEATPLGSSAGAGSDPVANGSNMNAERKGQSEEVINGNGRELNANAEIEKALRSLDDAEALVAKLQRRSKMHSNSNDQ